MPQALAPYRPGIVERISLAVKAFNLRFPSWGGGWGTAWNAFNWRTEDTQINYSEEIGDLTHSSLVMAAVRWVGNTMPEAPVVVREKVKGEDGKVKVEDVEAHELAELIRRPNPFYSGSTLWKAFAMSWIIDGNVYLLKRRNSLGRIVELWYVPHWMIEPAWPQDGSVFISHYVYTVDGKPFTIPYEDIVHFRDGVDPLNLRKGLSPLRSLQRELYGDIQSSRYTARYARNFGVPPFILSPKPDQNGVDVDTETIKASLMRAITGDNTGKPLVLSSAFEVKELAGRTAEVTSETNRRIPEERLAAVIGIPAMVLGFGAGLQRSTFSNMEQAHEYAYESYLMPLYRYVEEEMDVQLLPEFETKTNRMTGHDISQVRALQEDRDLLFKRMGDAYEQGYVKRSEARSAVNLTSGPEDEVYFKEPGQAKEPQDEMLEGQRRQERVVAGERLRLVKQIKAALGKNGKGVPSDEEIGEALEWWDEVAPDEAAGILNAAVANNGNGQRR